MLQMEESTNQSCEENHQESQELPKPWWCQHYNTIALLMCDLLAALDIALHEILLAKLKLYGLSPEKLKWFRSYLEGSTQKVDSNGSRSRINGRRSRWEFFMGPMLDPYYSSPISMISSACSPKLVRSVFMLMTTITTSVLEM